MNQIDTNPIIQPEQPVDDPIGTVKVLRVSSPQPRTWGWLVNVAFVNDVGYVTEQNVCYPCGPFPDRDAIDTDVEKLRQTHAQIVADKIALVTTDLQKQLSAAIAERDSLQTQVRKVEPMEVVNG